MSLLFVLPMLATPVAVAQEPGIVMLQDPRGDVLVRTPASETSNVVPHYLATDLLSLELVESEDHFEFIIDVADLDDVSEVYIVDDTTYYVGFSRGDQAYLIRLIRALAEQQYWWGSLEEFDDDGQSRTFIRPLLDRSDLAIDFDADTITVQLGREELQDTNGAAPTPGSTIHTFWAFAHLRSAEGLVSPAPGIVIGEGYDAYDHMPDDGVGVGEFVVQRGLLQEGNAALSSLAPMRASNGEAATFLYTITASNTGDAPDVFELEVGAVPPTWEVIIQDPVLSLDGGASRDIPVLVTTPFAHQHGSVQKFMLEMVSGSGAGTGRIELGIRYHEVPQPAGHHDTVYFHSHRYGEENPFFPITDNLFSGNGGEFYINTLEQDPNDQRVPVKGTYWGYGFHDGFPGDMDPRSIWAWFTWLQPGLQMGLDFDLTRTATISTTISTNAPIPAASAYGHIQHFGFDEENDVWISTNVGDLEPTEPQDLLPGTETGFTWEVTIHEEADVLHYTPRAYLGFFINLTSPRPAAFTGVEAPEMTPGGWAQLPLHEYRDPVDDLFQGVGSVSLVADGPAQKLVNSGEATLLGAILTNHRATAQTFDLRIDGVNKGWATIAGPVQVTLQPGESHTVRVPVYAPSDARQGDAADLVITAQSTTLEEARALVRLVAAVDDGSDHADESDAIAMLDGPGVRSTPMGALAMMVLAAALVTRRRSS